MYLVSGGRSDSLVMRYFCSSSSPDTVLMYLVSGGRSDFSCYALFLVLLVL